VHFSLTKPIIEQENFSCKLNVFIFFINTINTFYFNLFNILIYLFNGFCFEKKNFHKKTGLSRFNQ